MSMSLPNDTIILPVVSIDPTFPSVIKEVHAGIIPTETFWVSCYKQSEPSIHAKIEAELYETDRNKVLLKTIDGDLNISQGRNKRYIVSCKPLGIDSTPVLPPVQEYLDLERSNPQNPQRITALDISPDSSRFATGYLDGSVFLYPVTNVSSERSEPPSSPSDPPIYPAQAIKTPIPSRAIARPHLSTTTNLQFFPSSKVLLSSGADFSLSILPADLPDPDASTSTSVRLTSVRTLRAHTRPITATIMLGPGRNILSASLDGSLKLWDVPSSTVLSSLPASLTQPILSATLGPDDTSSAYPVSPTTEFPKQDEREVPEVNASTVFCGLQDGSVELFDLRSKRSVFRSSKKPAQGGIAAIAHLASHHLLATGSSWGVVTMYDTRALSSGSVTSFTRSQGGSGVEDLAFVDGVEDLAFVDGVGEEATGVGLAVATTDGLPYIAGVLPDGPVVMAELAGGDCDPFRRIKVRQTEGGQGRKRWDIWSAGDDAAVRRWQLHM